MRQKVEEGAGGKGAGRERLRWAVVREEAAAVKGEKTRTATEGRERQGEGRRCEKTRRRERR